MKPSARVAARFVRVWLAPVVLSILTLVGLASALLGAGWWDTIGWLLLGAVPALCVTALLRKRPQRLS